jgi:hypothetical protein
MTTTTSVSLRGSNRFGPVLFVANALVWAFFWVGFFEQSRFYPRLPSPTEGTLVSQVVADRAAANDASPNGEIYYRASFIPNLPAFIATRAVFNILFHGVRSPALYLGTTVAGYELICWMVVSFFQWFLVARLLAWISLRRHGTPGGADSGQSTQARFQ